MNKADINNLSLIHLQLIRLILEHGNASIAAQELGLTQSGISYHIKK
ncbi:LysR family transcriptional regulator [Shewanella indica]